MTKLKKKELSDAAHQKRVAAIQYISEKMKDLGEALKSIKNRGGIDKNTVTSLEDIDPGLVTQICHPNGFTQVPSKTNYGLMVNHIEQRIHALGDERDSILLDDSFFEPVKEGEAVSEQTEIVLDELTEIQQSLESMLTAGVNVDTVYKHRLKLEGICHNLEMPIDNVIPTMEQFANPKTATKALVVSLEEGVWEAIKNAWTKFWEWVKKTFKTILDWFKSQDKKARLANIEQFMEAFKDDGTAFEFEITEPEAKRLTIAGKPVEEVIKPIDDLLKLAKACNEWLPTMVKANEEFLEFVYKDAGGVKNEKDLKDLIQRGIDSVFKKYPIIVNAVQGFTPVATVKTEDEGKLILHYFGGGHLNAEMEPMGGVMTILKKISWGQDKSEATAGKFKLRASDSKVVGDKLKAILEEGWDDKHTRTMEEAIKKIESFETKYDNVKKDLAANKETAGLVATLVQREKFAVNLALSAVTARAAALKHVQGMEKFIISLYNKGKKADAKAKEPEKPNEAKK